MASVTSKNFDAPDETRNPEKTAIDVVHLGAGTTAARFTLQPGWKWSECVKPVAGTDSCQGHHVDVVVAGRLHIAHDDGTEMEAGAGEAYAVEPGHDAWVVGDEAFVSYEFDSSTAESYAAGA